MAKIRILWVGMNTGKKNFGYYMVMTLSMEMLKTCG